MYRKTLVLLPTRTSRMLSAPWVLGYKPSVRLPFRFCVFIFFCFRSVLFIFYCLTFYMYPCVLSFSGFVPVMSYPSIRKYRQQFWSSSLASTECGVSPACSSRRASPKHTLSGESNTDQNTPPSRKHLAARRYSWTQLPPIQEGGYSVGDCQTTPVSNMLSERRKMRTGSAMLRALTRYSVFLYMPVLSTHSKWYSYQK